MNALAAQKVNITLPDQSEVLLNAGSTISYYKRQWDTNRSLDLKGEAYFTVEKGSTFMVNTPKGTVTVVGTEFNVSQREDYFEVQCFEGIVDVVSDTIERRLTAGHTYRIHADTFSEGTTEYSKPEWTSNVSRFENMPISDVFEELERQFDINVEFNKIDSDRLFTGGFAHSNLENALEAITTPMNLNFTITTSNRVVIHETKE